MGGPSRLALWSGISPLETTGVARLLIVLGALLILAGLLWPWLVKLGLGRLPGDIVIERERVRIYLPITTSILVSLMLSLVLSLIFWFLNR